MLVFVCFQNNIPENHRFCFSGNLSKYGPRVRSRLESILILVSKYLLKISYFIGINNCNDSNRFWFHYKYSKCGDLQGLKMWLNWTVIFLVIIFLYRIRRRYNIFDSDVRHLIFGTDFLTYDNKKNTFQNLITFMWGGTFSNINWFVEVVFFSNDNQWST